MTLRNTTLDDIASVIGFTATLRLAAWFGEGSNIYVPLNVAEDQMLVRLLGLSAARRLTEAWPGEHLAVPRPQEYETQVQRRQIVDLLGNGFSSRKIGHFMRLSERRVQQIVRELEVAGRIAPIAPAEKPPAVLQKARAKPRGRKR
jgi:hypothetical protein